MIYGSYRNITDTSIRHFFLVDGHVTHSADWFTDEEAWCPTGIIGLNVSIINHERKSNTFKCFLSDSTSSFFIRVTVHPPNPPPVILEPKTPLKQRERSTS